MSDARGIAKVFAMPQPAVRVTQARLRDLHAERKRHQVEGQMIEREALAIFKMIEEGIVIESGPNDFDMETLEVVQRDRARAK